MWIWFGIPNPGPAGSQELFVSFEAHESEEAFPAGTRVS